MKKSLTFSVVMSVLFLGGCTSFFGIDDENFDCGNANGMSCSNVLTAYHETEGYDPETSIGEPRKRRWWKWWGKRKLHGVSPFYPAPIKTAASEEEPQPLMMPAKVMSVWVNSYEDEKGNLIYPTRIYSEINQRKWDTGYRLGYQTNTSRRVTPLVAKPSEPISNPNTEQPAEAASQVQQQTQTQQTGNNQTVPDSLPAGLIPPLK